MNGPAPERPSDAAGREGPLPRRFRASLTGRIGIRLRLGKVAAEGLPLRDGRDGPPAWEALVPPGAPVELEVGPGKGRFLLAAAGGRPGVFFVGVEAAPPYAFLTADRISRARLSNAVVVIDDAALFLEEAVPAGALAAIHVYFPDPWPKRRHRKRRFFRQETVPLLHRALAPDGLLLAATDCGDYFSAAAGLLDAGPFFARAPELEAPGALPPEAAFGPTHFEAKYLAEGRAIRRGAWRRLPLPCNPPGAQ